MVTSSIAEIRAEIFEAPFLSQLLVKVYQEDGRFGTGECWWGTSAPSAADTPAGPADHLQPLASVIEHLISPVLIGHNATRITAAREKAMHRAYRYGTDGIFMCALSGVDIALWDLLGKTLDAPVADLLGGLVKDHVRAYASLPPLNDRELIERETARALERGFTGIKLHETDTAAAGWVRELAGAEIAIMFDVNGFFSPLQARSACSQLARSNITWFEEPVFPERDLRALARLNRQSAVPLAAGENEFNLERFHLLLKDTEIDVVMPEISKIGGLSVAREIGVLAGLFNRTLSPHGYRVGPALYANIHWALTMPASDWVEVPFLPDGFEFPAPVEAPPLIEGKLCLPEGPGLGIRLNHANTKTAND